MSLPRRVLRWAMSRADRRDFCRRLARSCDYFLLRRFVVSFLHRSGSRYVPSSILNLDKHIKHLLTPSSEPRRTTHRRLRLRSLRLAMDAVDDSHARPSRLPPRHRHAGNLPPSHHPRASETTRRPPRPHTRRERNHPPLHAPNNPPHPAQNARH